MPKPDGFAPANRRRPRLYYKYYAPRDYVFESLEANAVYASRYGELNDPFDPILSVLHRDNVGPGYLKGPDMLTAFTSLFSAPCIFCASARPDDELMWAHYASNNRGFCIGYEDPSWLMLPVTYTSDLGSFYKAAKGRRNRTATYWHCLVKTKPWAHEREWRWVFPEPLNPALTIEEQRGRLAPGFFDLKEVIIGNRTSSDDIHKLLSAVHRYKPRYRAVLPVIEKGGRLRFRLEGLRVELVDQNEPVFSVTRLAS